MRTGDSHQRSVCIAFANGCPRSMMNIGLLTRYFQANGWELKERLDEADLVVVAACGVHSLSERESIRCLSLADAQRKPGSRLIVLGCITGASEKRVREKFDAILVRPKELNRLDDIVEAEVKLREVSDPNYLEPYIEKATKPFSKRCTGFLGRTYAPRNGNGQGELSWLQKPRRSEYGLPLRVEHADQVFSVRVAVGCLEECSYCAIRFAAGTLRSKPLDRILAEFDSGLRQGFEVFHLIAGDLGAYGQDIGANVSDLVCSLLERPGHFRLLLRDFHPRWFIRYASDLIDVLAAHPEKIARLQLPLESGSERILRLMRRQYTAADLRQCLSHLRMAAPNIPLGTHVMVGFPGETEDDFQDTVEFLQTFRFDEVHVYQYDDRPDTEASRMTGKLPEGIKKSRATRLRKALTEVCSFAN